MGNFKSSSCKKFDINNNVGTIGVRTFVCFARWLCVYDNMIMYRYWFIFFINMVMCMVCLRACAFRGKGIFGCFGDHLNRCTTKTVTTRRRDRTRVSPIPLADDEYFFPTQFIRSTGKFNTLYSLRKQNEFTSNSIT